MPPSSSGARAAVEHIRTVYVPALTVGVVALLVLYAGIAAAAGGEVMALGDALIVCGFALVAAHVAAAQYPRYVQTGVAWLAIVVIPAGLLVVAIGLGLRRLAAHLAVIMLADSLVWGLVIGVIEECAGIGRQAPGSPQTTYSLTLRFPFVVAREQRASRRTPPATGGSLASLIALAVVVLAVAEAARAGGARGLPHPFPFAVLALGALGALASLSRLIQQVGDTRRSVQIGPGFAEAWMRSALIVLGICALVALLIPKQIVTEPMRPVRDNLWGQMQNTDVRYGGSETRPRPVPFGGRNQGVPGQPGQNQGQARRAGANRLRQPQEAAALRGLRALAAGGVEALIRAATVGEASPNGQGAQIPGPGATGTQPGAQETATSGSRPGGEFAQPETFEQKTDRLERLLGENPMRAIKLILLVLGVLSILYVLNRYVRPLILPFARWLGRKAAAFYAAIAGPIRRRMAAERHDRAVRGALARLQDPFADPFESREGRDAEEIAGLAYESFLAHVWVWGQQKGSVQTAFDFARHLCDSTALDRDAVWTVTRDCVEAQFSESRTAGDFAALRQALATIAAQVERTLGPQTVQEKRSAYRRMLAAQAVAEAQDQHPLESAGPAAPALN